MNLILDKYGWVLIELSIETSKYNRIYKTASYKEETDGNISIKYHSRLWILQEDLDIYFLCENIRSNWNIYHIIEELEYNWDSDLNKILLVKSNLNTSDVGKVISEELLFSKQILRDYKISKIFN